MAEALRPLRPLRAIEAPGTLDGGDVLRVGRRVFVGLTTRTNEEGARQLTAVLAPLGYEVTRVPVRGMLHLKSAASALGDDIVLLDRAAVDAALFRGLRAVEVHPDERFAANVLAVTDHVLCPAGGPRTAELVSGLGFRVIPVDNSELARAEAGLTCCSLLVSL
jgi:dimethylargininase